MYNLNNLQISTTTETIMLAKHNVTNVLYKVIVSPANNNKILIVSSVTYNSKHIHLTKLQKNFTILEMETVKYTPMDQVQFETI
jgi:hypothetical protein